MFYSIMLWRTPSNDLMCSREAKGPILTILDQAGSDGGMGSGVTGVVGADVRQARLRSHPGDATPEVFGGKGHPTGTHTSTYNRLNQM